MKRQPSQPSIYYSELRWPELKKMAARKCVVLLPVGQTEQHGPHLPVGTDHFISAETARCIAESAVKEMPVLVMPTVWCGYSSEDLFHWPGVISMPPEIVMSVIENICVSLSRSGFNRIVILNSHGHHDGLIKVAARKIMDRCKAVVIVTNIWRMAPEEWKHLKKSACCHACEYETALMLHFNKRVDQRAATDEPVRPRSRFVGADMCGSGSKVFWSTWRYQKSKTGTYGCPSHATRAEGAKINEVTVKAYLQLMREFRAAP
jgi:creatinine amidohydrolase